MNPRHPIAANIALAFAFAAVALSAYVAGERHEAVWSPPAPTAACASPVFSAPDAAPALLEEDARFASAPAGAVAEEEDVNKVRQAARDLVLKKHPGSRIEGVFTLALGRSGLYIAGADTLLDKEQRATYDVLVRLYTRKNGSTYWRAEWLGREEAAALLRQK